MSKFLFPFKLWQRRLPTYFDRGSRPKHGKTSNLLDEDSAGKDEAAASLFAMTMIYGNNFKFSIVCVFKQLLNNLTQLDY